ncbi:hypothetical protein ACQKOF_12030 [Lysinibacillus sp. NPDC093190]|uniref:hypothetical protein n=1 Tax=Lysinibacillus sp. NPDC093190 TaxID=3390575 RepID=UPI003D01BE4D
MRLKLLHTNLGELEVSIEIILEAGQFDKINLHQLSNKIYDDLENNNINGYFDSDLERLEHFKKKSSDYAWSSNMIYDFTELLSIIGRDIKSLRTSISIALDNTELNIDNVYAIKLPKFEYFDDMANFSKIMNRIFSQVFGNNKKAKLVGFDVGSEWFLIGLDSFVSFKLFSIFMNGVYQYLKRNKQDEEDIKDSHSDESKQMMLEHMEKIKNLLIADTIKRMGELHERPLAPEERSALEKSFMDMSKLIQMGTEVHIDKQTPSKDENNQDTPKVEIPKIETIKEYLGDIETLFLEELDEESKEE